MTEGQAIPSGERLKLRGEALDWVDVEGEIVVLDGERSIYLAPNDSGSVLWRRLIDGVTEEDLAAALSAEFEIPPEQAKRDVRVFVEQLKGLGLLAEP